MTFTVDNDKLQIVIVNLLKEAQGEVWDDDPDFMTDDYAGGNIDDAFAGGERAGRAHMARDALDVLGVSWL